MKENTPKIALGAWSWGVGAAGGDQVFGNHLFEEDLKPVFDKAMALGLNLWDTAAVYGEGTSERILGNFVKQVEEAAASARITLTADEIERLEKLGDESGVHTLREWEKEM